MSVSSSAYPVSALHIAIIRINAHKHFIIRFISVSSYVFPLRLTIILSAVRNTREILNLPIRLNANNKRNSFTLFLVSAALSLKPLRWLFSNPVARFLGAISYNLYLYHQRLIVLLRMSLGFQSGADVAAAGTKMQIFLTAEALGLSLLLAAVLTYLWEKPIRRWILTWGQKKEKPTPAQADTISESTERK